MGQPLVRRLAAGDGEIEECAFRAVVIAHRVQGETAGPGVHGQGGCQRGHTLQGGAGVVVMPLNHLGLEQQQLQSSRDRTRPDRRRRQRLRFRPATQPVQQEDEVIGSDRVVEAELQHPPIGGLLPGRVVLHGVEVVAGGELAFDLGQTVAVLIGSRRGGDDALLARAGVAERHPELPPGHGEAAVERDRPLEQRDRLLEGALVAEPCAFRIEPERFERSGGHLLQRLPAADGAE